MGLLREIIPDSLQQYTSTSCKFLTFFSLINLFPYRKGTFSHTFHGIFLARKIKYIMVYESVSGILLVNSNIRARMIECALVLLNFPRLG